MPIGSFFPGSGSFMAAIVGSALARLAGIDPVAGHRPDDWHQKVAKPDQQELNSLRREGATPTPTADACLNL